MNSTPVTLPCTSSTTATGVCAAASPVKPSKTTPAAKILFILETSIKLSVRFAGLAQNPTSIYTLAAGRRTRAVLRGVKKVHRGSERLVVLWIRRDIRLRCDLLHALAWQMSRQRGFAQWRGLLFDVIGFGLQNLDVGQDALGLNRCARRGEVTRRRQP